ncbi:MAG TPA: response regulator [Hyphomicrobiales bacterium]|nr:response regulator [Hyphomicrobiales bacterium]
MPHDRHPALAPATQARRSGELRRRDRVLVVDDDAQAAVLERSGLAVCSVDAAGAWRELEPGRWDAMLIDLGAANETCFSLLAHARTIDSALRILTFSAYASVAMAVRAIKLGADDCLAKPTPSATLLRALLRGGDAGDAMPAPAEPMVPEHLEWTHIQQILAQQDGNVSATARALHMHRRTLQRKLAKCPFTPQRCAV